MKSYLNESYVINEAIENVGWIDSLLNYGWKFEKKRYPEISKIISCFLRDKYLVDVSFIGQKIAFLVAELEYHDKMQVRINIETLKNENEKIFNKHIMQIEKHKREEWAEWRM